MSAGRTAQAVGKHLEQIVAAQIECATQARLVVWSAHNQPLFRQVGPARFVRAQASGADWSLVFNGALAGALEVKGTADRRFYRSAITDLQQEHLEQVARAGGLAVLLVQFRSEAGWPIYRVPWQAVPWERASATKDAPSVTAEAVEPWRFNPGGGLFDGLVVQCKGCGVVRLVEVQQRLPGTACKACAPVAA